MATPQDGHVPLAAVTAASQGEGEAVHPVAGVVENQREDQFGAPNTLAPVGVVASMLAARRHSWCNRGTHLGRLHICHSLDNTLRTIYIGIAPFAILLTSTPLILGKQKK